jgi:predicted RNA-binding Zn-ribbon protein involved in translation (DUF1610 family)
MTNKVWYTAWFCFDCNAELSWNTVMYSYGRCPHCGEKSGYGATIVNTRERAYYKERIAPWWKFWTPQFKRVFKDA